jgi:hypothetical protein
MNVIPQITVDALTKNELEGTGVFDELMRSVKAHLEEEISNDRITTVNYASVYLGALQSTMDQSVKFLLEMDKSNLQNAILEQERVNLVQQGEIIELERRKLEIEIYNSKYQECVIKAGLAKAEAEVQGVLQTNANERTKASLLVKQIAKTEAETRLFGQRTTTEMAQVSDKIDGVSVGGITGAQKEMYRNQANGYLRLAEQQNARMMLDAFSVLQTNAGLDNFEGDVSDWGVDPISVQIAVRAMSQGIIKQEDEHGHKDTAVIGNMPSTNHPVVTPTEPSSPTTCTVTVPPIPLPNL